MLALRRCGTSHIARRTSSAHSRSKCECGRGMSSARYRTTRRSYARSSTYGVSIQSRSSCCRGSLSALTSRIARAGWRSKSHRGPSSGASQRRSRGIRRARTRRETRFRSHSRPRCRRGATRSGRFDGLSLRRRSRTRSVARWTARRFCPGLRRATQSLRAIGRSRAPCSESARRYQRVSLRDRTP